MRKRLAIKRLTRSRFLLSAMLWTELAGNHFGGRRSTMPLFRRVKDKHEEARPLMVLSDRKNSVELWPTKLTIRRHGVLNAINVGLAGEKGTYLNTITGIQLRKPGTTAGLPAHWTMKAADDDLPLHIHPYDDERIFYRRVHHEQTTSRGGDRGAPARARQLAELAAPNDSRCGRSLLVSCPTRRPGMAIRGQLGPTQPGRRWPADQGGIAACGMYGDPRERRLRAGLRLPAESVLSR
jgi:hypothetical protein